MTTFQDLPPQSRRSARQSERGERPDTPAGFIDFTPPLPSAEPQSPTETPEASNDESLRTGELPHTSGRRARASVQQGLFQVPANDEASSAPEPAAEPLEYMTQGRDLPDTYRAPEPQQPPQPQFRVRDFSPEGRSSGRRAAAPPLIEPDPRPSVTQLPTDLDYRTQGGPVAPVAPAAFPFAAPASESSTASTESETVDAAPVVAAPTEYPTLSRRELRAKLAEEEAARAALLTGPLDPALTTGTQDSGLLTGPQAELLTGPQASALLTGPQASALLTGPQASALLTGPQASPLLTGPQNASLSTGARSFEQAPPPPASALLTGPQPPAPSGAPRSFAPPPPAPSSRVTDQVPPAPSTTTAQPAFTAEAARGPIVFPAPPSAMTPPVVTPSAPERTDSNAGTALDTSAEQTGGWSAPVGHWSRQADLDDESQPWENTVTREVGGGNVATTTSALVLPEMPLANPFPSALTGTGEVLLTGSIELPRSLSNGNGDSRHFDDSDVDLMYDTPDTEFAGTDSAPVSAIRAVSTHTSARGVISSKKPSSNRSLTVLLVAASVMAVGVVVLLVAGLMGNVF